MNDQHKIASEILTLAVEIEAGNKTAFGVFNIYKRHFDAVFTRMDALIKSVKRRKDLVDREPTIRELDKIYNGLENLWVDLGMALQSEENLY